MLRFAMVLIPVAALLGGCAAGPTKIPAPSGRLMAPPEPFPKITGNDDTRAKLVEAAHVCTRNSYRQMDLQKWAREASQ